MFFIPIIMCSFHSPFFSPPNLCICHPRSLFTPYLSIGIHPSRGEQAPPPARSVLQRQAGSFHRHSVRRHQHHSSRVPPRHPSVRIPRRSAAACSSGCRAHLRPRRHPAEPPSRRARRDLRRSAMPSVLRRRVRRRQQAPLHYQALASAVASFPRRLPGLRLCEAGAPPPPHTPPRPLLPPPPLRPLPRQLLGTLRLQTPARSRAAFLLRACLVSCPPSPLRFC
mmetsp:Transcript_10806/g.28856  ORF Transcript_10806/g.28856 Transcript_10806/m.28856 type:complete len:224 (-) Transcript_10806:423-1094(-)